MNQLQNLNDELVNVAFTTQFGEATFADMLRAYENEKRHQQRRKEWFKTEEGRAYNRMKAKRFYEAHKNEILAKRKESYTTRKNTKANVSVGQDTTLREKPVSTLADHGLIKN